MPKHIKVLIRWEDFCHRIRQDSPNLGITRALRLDGDDSTCESLHSGEIVAVTWPDRVVAPRYDEDAMCILTGVTALGGLELSTHGDYHLYGMDEATLWEWALSHGEVGDEYIIIDPRQLRFETLEIAEAVLARGLAPYIEDKKCVAVPTDEGRTDFIIRRDATKA